MSTEDERKLFVAGLPDSITEEVLRQIFEATGGTVVDVSLPRHRDTGRPRGFGFVTLSSAEEAASARGSLDGSLQAGRSISVRPFQSEPPRREGGPGGPRDGAPSPQAGGPDRTLYVGNLPYDATQADVETLFSEVGAGPVVRVHLPTGPDGRARGFGFVTMGSAEAANGAIVALREKELRGRRLMINIAHPRGERPAGDRPPRREDGGFDRGSGGGGGFDCAGGPPSRDFEPPAVDLGTSAKPEGRRDRWDRTAEKKKKKKRGRKDAEPAVGRRGKVNPKDWEDWED